MSDFTPCIIIPGFGQSKAELFDENGNSKKVWPLSVDAGPMLKALVGPYMKTVICRKDMGFTDTAYKLYCDCFEPFTFDEKGKKLHDLRAVTHNYSLAKCNDKVKKYVNRLVPVKSLIDVIGEDKVYFFAYNAFADPYETADELDKFIALVRSETNSEKVNLLPYSMGGSIAVAYFDEYGEKNEIDRVMFLVSALGGSKLNSDIMTRNIDKKEGYSLLKFATNSDTVKTFKRVLSLTTWPVRYKLLYRSLDAVSDKVLNNSPGMWGLVTPEDYSMLREKHLSDKPELRAITDRFNYAKLNAREIIAKQQSRGVKFFSCLGYGLPIMPLSASKTLSTDGLLHVASPSLGATAAKLGETLDVAESEYISPDRTIDASTGFLPETTWYVKNGSHFNISSNETVDELVRKVLSDKNFTDVNSDSKLGRFI